MAMTRRTGKNGLFRGPESLARVLRLEARRGYDNKAVAGGTSRLLLAWLEPAAGQARSWRSRHRLKALCGALAVYPDVPVRRRSRLIGLILRYLDGFSRRPSVPLSLRSPVSHLPGIGPRRAFSFASIGILTVEDLLLWMPSRYLDATTHQAVAELPEDKQAVVCVRVTREPRCIHGTRASRVEAPAEDDTGSLILQWFNQPYRVDQIREGDRLVLMGKARPHGGRLFFVVSRILRRYGDDGREDCDTSRTSIVPEYRVPEGVTQQVIRNAISVALSNCWTQIPPLAPPPAVAGCGLLARPLSFRALHRPASSAEAEIGRRSIAFEQLLVLQTRLLQHRAQARSVGVTEPIRADSIHSETERLAGFSLTAAQRRVIGEIAADLADSRPAYRLIHGDVGSGKTVVAAAALLAAVKAGKQAALMAPTELLAEQHAWRLSRMLGPEGIRVYLLTGSIPSAAKEEFGLAARSGEAAVFVGTHALIQSSIHFGCLSVVVVDEQHRFGVAQRAALAAKGYCPNFFAMSATPIPRTLALALYADFDISVLDDLPPGRRPVITRFLATSQRRRAYALLRARLEAGHQGFVVCPLIQPSHAIEAEAAEEWFQRLRTGLLEGLRLGLVHGSLSTPERQRVMQAFYDGEIQALVSTSIIEVGLDVPRASVILVENAERFGLAQIHQLRGRVARSRHQPLCVLLSDATSPESRKRLQVLARYSDGFRIAEADLRMRGAGELAGLRQHGVGDWVIGDVLAYPDLLAAAQRQAREILRADPQLTLPEHAELRRAVQALGALEKGQWAL